MRGLPLLLVFRAGAGVEVVTAGVAGGEGLVPVKDYAHLVCYCVVRGAHNGEDVAVTGTGGLGVSDYSSSGCWPSWAIHAHSVIFISVKTAVKEDSSGEQA